MHGRAAILSSIWNHPLNRGSRIRAISDYFLWNIVKYTMDGRHVLHLTNDLEIILGRKENYGSAVYANNLSDYPEMMFLAHMLRPGNLFLDVGSNVGMYSVWVSGVAGAHCIAFEPVPETHAKLVKNIRLNALGDKITAHQMAAGEAAGSISMTASKGGLDHVIIESTASSGTVQVAVGRIDHICAGSAPVAMKVDVEGFEMQALRGATGLLQNPSLKAIVIELQDWMLRRCGTSETEVRAFLGSYGFRPHVYNPETRSLNAPDGKASLNEIFLRDLEEVAALLKSGPIVRLPARPHGV